MYKFILLLMFILCMSCLTFAEDNVKKQFYDTGELECEIQVKNGVYNGSYACYYKSGALMDEGTFVNGIQEGKRQLYYESGEIKQTDTFKNDKLNGITQTFYKNGALKQKVFLKMVKKQVQWNFIIKMVHYGQS